MKKRFTKALLLVMLCIITITISKAQTWYEQNKAYPYFRLLQGEIWKFCGN